MLNPRRSYSHQVRLRTCEPAIGDRDLRRCIASLIVHDPSNRLLPLRHLAKSVENLGSALLVVSESCQCGCADAYDLQVVYAFARAEQLTSDGGIGNHPYFRVFDCCEK